MGQATIGDGSSFISQPSTLNLIRVSHTVDEALPKDPKLWELWYIPYYGSCRIYIINSMIWSSRSWRERLPSSHFGTPKPGVY